MTSPHPRFAVVAAIDESRGLGKDGDLPWYIPEDLKHFARVTTQRESTEGKNAVIMGRVTCESVPDKYWPLKDRNNYVITRNPDWQIEGATVHPSLDEALRRAEAESERLFVVGGGQIYTLALELDACDELILTRIFKRYDCDAFFPEYESRYHLSEEIGGGEHEGVEYRFERWIRNAS